jgi:hypothetical protein
MFGASAEAINLLRLKKFSMTQTHDHASKKKLCVDVSESFGLTIGTVGNYRRGNSKN